MSNEPEIWWEEDRDTVAKAIWDTVRRIEMQQSDIFDRLHRLEVLYDPNTPMVADTEDGHRGGVHENAIASNVDTVTAMISTSDVRATIETDGADWNTQRRMRQLELYAEELAKRFKILPHCRGAFKECAKKGNGLVKVTEQLRSLRVQQVMVENIVVDQNETRDNREPMQLHEWVACDADELIARFPQYEEEIKNARQQRQHWRIDQRYVPMFDNQVVYLESFRLPIGTKGKKGYKPGRWAITIDGLALLYKKWHKNFFPYAMQVWSKRAKSWYGIGGAERIAGIQRALNKRNWQIEKQLDRAAVPTMFVRPADANIRAQTSRIGAVAVARGEYPKWIEPLAVTAETYKSRLDLRDSARDEFGLSQLATHGALPPGVESGVAMREYKDQTSDRYGPQEKGFEEDLVLRSIWLALDVCKDLGADAPEMVRNSRFGSRRMKFKDVRLEDVEVQLYAASTLPRTPAGRMQFVIELAQAGVISTDSATRLLNHPDLEAELSLYTAAIESCEECLDEIADGTPVMPEPFMALGICRWRGQREYLKWRSDGAPEEILEALRDFVVTAAWMEQQPANANQQPGMPAAAAANVNAGPPGPPGAGAGPPGPGDASGLPSMTPLPPGAGTPQAAFSQQAMNLVAGAGG